jgi:hypothetical protein
MEYEMYTGSPLEILTLKQDWVMDDIRGIPRAYHGGKANRKIHCPIPQSRPAARMSSNMER